MILKWWATCPTNNKSKTVNSFSIKQTKTSWTELIIKWGETNKCNCLNGCVDPWKELINIS